MSVCHSPATDGTAAASVWCLQLGCAFVAIGKASGRRGAVLFQICCGIYSDNFISSGLNFRLFAVIVIKFFIPSNEGSFRTGLHPAVPCGSILELGASHVCNQEGTWNMACPVRSCWSVGKDLRATCTLWGRVWDVIKGALTWNS